MSRGRIDVHQHIVPPAYAARPAGKGLREAGERDIAAWSAEAAGAMRDAHEIRTGILSVSTPRVHHPGAADHDQLFAELAVTYFTSQLDAHDLRGAPRATDRGNAEALFPRFAPSREEIP